VDEGQSSASTRNRVCREESSTSAKSRVRRRREVEFNKE
jgi:hypothetical protein